MKKVALVASLAIIGFAVTAFIAPHTAADGNFEGIITYSISVDNASNPQAASMFQNSSMKVYIKGDRTKTCTDMGMMKTTFFTNKNTPDDPIILMDMMGSKYQLKNDKTKIKDTKAPDIKYTDETKQIAGYNCHKAEVTVTGKQEQSVTLDVYYTEDLPAWGGEKNQFKGLKGFPMEFSMQQPGMNFSMTVTSVDKQSIPDSTFNVPSGYKLMTPEEMQEDMQKNMGGGGN